MAENVASETGESEKQVKKKVTGSAFKKSKGKKKEKISEFDWPKKNYFEVCCIEEPEHTMKNLVHRLVYIGKLRDESVDRNEVGNHYEKILKHYQNVYQTEPITGLLLIYLKHLVHVMEASSDMLVETMRDVVHHQMQDNGFLESAKILIVSHDVQNRLYQQWAFRTLDIQAARLEAYETSEGCDKVIIDLLTNLLKLGNKLATTPKISLKGTMDSLHEKFPDLLPQQSVVHYLLEENDSSMILPTEFLDLYEKPFDVVLESEMVWPLPTRTFPYN